MSDYTSPDLVSNVSGIQILGTNFKHSDEKDIKYANKLSLISNRRLLKSNMET